MENRFAYREVFKDKCAEKQKVRKYTHSIELAYNAVGKLFETVMVCDATSNDVLTAFQKKSKDFEDGLVLVCARSNNCNYIITRNKKDFENFEVEALTPTEFLNMSM